MSKTLSDDEANTGLLDDHEVQGKEVQEAVDHDGRRRGRPQSVFLWILAVLYVPLVVSFAWQLIQNRSNVCSHPDLIPSPALEASVVEYETRRIPVPLKDNPFAGDPSPELDHAWHNLFENNEIRVSGRDLEQAGLSSLELADGSGYVAQLGVFHQLHCLKRIRHWVYRDYYHSNDTAKQSKENKAHIDHCIEMLREVSICHADLAFSTFRWLSDDEPQPTAEDKALHQCVKWDKLRSWVNQRAVRIWNPGVLRQPGT